MSKQEMITLYDAYNAKGYKGYLILFGNSSWGWNVPNKKHLKKFWGKAIRCSQSIGYGDVVLMFEGKIVRGLANANIKVTDKDFKYKYKRTKYAS